MSWRTALVAATLALWSAALAAGGEARAPAPEAKPKPPAEIEVQPPFTKLYSSKYHRDRVRTLTELLPRAGELADAARAEAARLKALPAPRDDDARGILDFAISSLEAIAAEPELMKSWKQGLPGSAQKLAGKVVAMDCKDRPLGEILKKASAGWGLTIEMSPAAWRAAGAMDASLEGSPTLQEFLDWLCAEQTLVLGQSGEKVVLVLPASLRLQESLEKARGEKK